MPDTSKLAHTARVFLAALMLAGSAFAQPVINEFLTNNGGTLLDADDDSSDWIELFNPGPGPVDLGGYMLTDDPDLPQKWTFPGGATLPEEAFLVVFASGKDRAVAGQELHTNFSLDSAGEYLALADPSGILLQEFAPGFPNQKRDVAYGIASDGNLAYLDPPTPSQPNGPPLAGFVADTVFSTKRGFYTNPVTVAITSATPGALIRYTTNGSEPTPSTGLLYSSPLTISRSTVLRALAYKPGMVPTNVDAQTYLFASDIVTQSGMNRSITGSSIYRREMLSSLQGLPVVSLSFNNSDLFGFSGIHTNPLLSGRASERDVHFEFFDPANPANSTHEPGGVRIHGGNSREHPKKNFRLYFRDDYGKPRLNHDLFPGSPVRSFKQLLLRGGGHDAWTFRSTWNQASLIRNEFLHRVQLEMGQPSPRGRFVSLFLNGKYWGVFELQELPHQHFNADHHGGAPEDWDVIKHGAELEAGTLTAWNEMISRAEAGISTSLDYDALQEYVDLENFADAMIHRIWSSDEDWLSPEFRNSTDISQFDDDKNWYVARKSRNGPGKFIFYSWDAEMSMGIPFSATRSYENDFTRVNNPDSPGIIYDRLRRYPEFQLHFADRLHKHLFNGGALTVPRLEAHWDALVREVRAPIVAESARWGLESWTGTRTFPYTRDGQWLPAVNWVRSEFIANRSEVILQQFRDVGLYPGVQAPTLSPPGPVSPDPINLSLSSGTPGSTIYFTTDGTDPRRVPQQTTIPLITADHEVKAIVPNISSHNAIGTTWRHYNDPSNISFWITGLNGVGFEGAPFSTPNFTSLIRTPLNNMETINPSAYIRITFQIPDQATLDSLTGMQLRMRYDDGFIAYLNGFQIESQNANAGNWNSAATASRTDAEAIEFATFDQTNALPFLTVGRNVLAIHGLNQSARNNDFLIQAVLEGTVPDSSGPLTASAQEYTAPIPVSETTRIMARTLDPAGTWSALTDIRYWIGTPAKAGDLTVSELHYHPSNPVTAAELSQSTSDNDFEFIELLNLRNEARNLSFCRFDDGIDYVFPNGSRLDAGARGLLVSNRAAFLARYGTTLDAAILGEFANNTNLSNKGEHLTLRDAEGAPLFDFEFDDSLPWPTEPDGDGPSLVLVDPSTTPPAALGEAAHWRASLLDDGAPDLADVMSFELWTRKVYGPLAATDPSVSAPLVIPPGSPGLPNLLLYAQGQDLSNNDPIALADLQLTTVDENDYLTLSFQLRDDLRGVNVIPEVSGDLLIWDPATAVVRQEANGDGTTTFTIRDLIPVDTATQRYLRLKVVR